MKKLCGIALIVLMVLGTSAAFGAPNGAPSPKTDKPGVKNIGGASEATLIRAAIVMLNGLWDGIAKNVGNTGTETENVGNTGSPKSMAGTDTGRGEPALVSNIGNTG